MVQVNSQGSVTGQGRSRGKGRAKRPDSCKAKSSEVKRVSKNVKNQCPTCHAPYNETEQWIECYLCEFWFHSNCAGLLSEDEWNMYNETENGWCCRLCTL